MHVVCHALGICALARAAPTAFPGGALLNVTHVLDHGEGGIHSDSRGFGRTFDVTCRLFAE